MATGDKNMWDNYVMYFTFSMNYAQMLDQRSIPWIFEVDRLLHFHHWLDKFHDFSRTPNPHHVSRVLTILRILEQETVKVWLKEIARYNLTEKIATCPEKDLPGLAKKALALGDKEPREVLEGFLELAQTHLRAQNGEIAA